MSSSTIAKASYEDHRAYVLGVLARRCRWLGAEDREAALHDAYAVLLEKQRDGVLDVEAMNEHQVRAYLTQTALNKALSEGSRAYRRTSVALEEGGLEAPDGALAADDALARDWDSARLREIVAELPERQQVVIALRYFFDRAPDEIQHYLGITERVYRREMERAMRTLSARMAEVRDGSFCESRRSLILAYVSGIAGPNRMRDARRHLQSCTGCAAWAFELRHAAREAGAVVPLPVIVGGGLVDDGGDRLVALGHGTRGLRDRLADLLSGGREHATGLATRADPATGSLLGALRPGTVAAVVAGCLGVGSTATYCVFEGLPAPLAGHRAPAAKAEAKEPKAKPAAKVATTAAVTVPAAVSAAERPASTAKTKTTTKSASTSTKTTKKQRQRAKARKVARATAPEFGVEGTGTATPPAASPAASSASSGSSSGSTSAANGGWGQEFGP
ncbi:MAG TPA: sigma-70 family RNA polymerase sigma factor [Baekduia sp.]|uniref:RNA polymerase sigma factor n=1 Tax=Baekduia sp. TaxID=2600305 RepID=UPI002D77FAD5|nr:sigma-70 family RNA polymerase sigma factor [Baekduia sp.]HET6507057.1 sigma-70 family RNA polymerase sigma factor [Baekduia sp.]